ncbi:MAG: ABC transporter ATP-binding protein [Chloroflexota bacterium]|nr:ABC transporter ATP-binding protein [Chloroflexota bacterium]
MVGQQPEDGHGEVASLATAGLDSAGQAASPASHGETVQLRDLYRAYGQVVAVDHISLDVAPGEFLTLLGPSGSGKTTTLMMIAGFVSPDGGQILVGGRPMEAVPPHKRELGMVFQHYSLFPHMTVGQNIAFPLELRGVSRKEIRARVAAVLELVRLPGLGGRSPHQLSGGQQQRVALARALVYSPPVLLLDEPLGALDKQLREELQLEIKGIQRRLGITMIYVTHDQAEALTMSDRIAVMHGGRIEQLGTGDELYERPRTAFVAGFLGQSNFLYGHLVEPGVAECRVEIANGFRLAAGGCVFNPGEQVVVAIRPEKLRLADRGLAGAIEATIYIGDVSRYRVRVPELGTSLLVQRQNGTGPVRLRGGDQVHVTWDLAGALVLPADIPG